MVNINPKKLAGRWRAGYALDHHTTSSVYLGDDELGHPAFDTKRSEIGELLYQLKYSQTQVWSPRSSMPLQRSSTDGSVTAVWSWTCSSRCRRHVRGPRSPCCWSQSRSPNVLVCCVSRV